MINVWLDHLQQARHTLYSFSNQSKQILFIAHADGGDREREAHTHARAQNIYTLNLARAIWLNHISIVTTQRKYRSWPMCTWLRSVSVRGGSLESKITRVPVGIAADEIIFRSCPLCASIERISPSKWNSSLLTTLDTRRGVFLANTVECRLCTRLCPVANYVLDRSGCPVAKPSRLIEAGGPAG